MCYTGICPWEACNHEGECSCTKPAKDLCFSEVMGDKKYHDQVYNLLNAANQYMQLFLYYRANGDQKSADNYLFLAHAKLVEVV